MRILFILCLLLVCQLSQAQTDLQILNIHGKVKSIASITYNIDTPGRKSWVSIDTNLFNKAGNWLLRKSVAKDTQDSYYEVFTYDSSGYNILSNISYYTPGVIDEATWYTYDKAGNLVQRLQRNSPDDDGTWSSILYTDIYGDDNRPIKGYVSYGDNDTGFDRHLLSHMIFYDPQGRKKKFESYDDTGSVNYVIIYDAWGRQSKYINRDNWYTLYTYNANGKCTADSSFSPSGEVLRVTLRAFDRYGNEKEYQVYNEKKVRTYDYRYRYEQIDKAGNWRRMIFYNEGRPSRITERSISYYK